MTALPVVLVDIHSGEHHFTPLPQDIRAPTASATQAKTQATCQPPVSTSPPPPPPPPPTRKPNRRASPGRIYVNVCIWMPRLLMVLSALQSPRRPTWTNRRAQRAKFFFLPGVDWCITTVNSSLTRRRVLKALLPFFCPTKPPISKLSHPCMASVQAPDHAPHQIKFDMDSPKFLIDSGASAHIWNRCKDFISYRVLSPQERKNDQVLGVSGETVALQGIGSIRLRIEDDLNDIHTIHLHDVWFLPEAPINIFFPQVFSQQRQAEGDSNASCSISADSITLQWTGKNGKQTNKYIPLNKSNVRICFAASGYKQFRAFAALCGMPATLISDDEEDEPTNSPAEGPITMTPSEAPEDKPPRSESEGVTTDFTVNPTVIPSDDQDGPLLKSDQAALMRLHEQLGHCSFAQLKQMAEQGIIPRKLAKVPPPKCPSCLYGKAHRKPWRTHKIDPKIKPTTIPGAVVSIDQLESQFRDSCPLQKGNLRSKGTEVHRCLWTMHWTSRKFTCTNTSQRTKQSTRNTRSSVSPNNTGY